MNSTNRIEKFIWVLSAVLIIAAWFAGRYIEEKSSLEHIKEKLSKSSLEHIKEKLSNYAEIKQSTPNSFLAFKKGLRNPIAFITKGEGIGYGGELSILVEVDTIAHVQSITLINQKETHSFLKKVLNKGFLDGYKKLNLKQFIDNYNFPDAVSGATYTSRGIHQAIMNAIIPIANTQFSIELKTLNERNFVFGLPEIVLILLYGIAFFLNFYKSKRTKLIRWFTILASIIFIGFVARKLLTLSQIGGFILGFWPNFYEFTFWYILLFGLILGIFVKGNNHYCDWVCPFGNTQELLGKIGNAKSPKLKFRNQLRWTQRFIALAAIVLGLIYRNPSKTSFEVFSGLFVFIGSDLLFIALALIIILSLFIKSPWCNYLCPVKPSINYIQKFREIFLKK